MSGVSLKLSGSLMVNRAADCPPGTTDVGPVFSLALLSTHMAFPGGSEISQKEMSVNDPGNFTALAVPSTLRGQVFYFRPLSGAFNRVQLTHATAGAVAYPVNGMLLIEVPAAEQISAVSVDGSGTFEWVLAGVLV